jgi:hypothetical protein
LSKRGLTSRNAQVPSASDLPYPDSAPKNGKPSTTFELFYMHSASSTKELTKSIKASAEGGYQISAGLYLVNLQAFLT